MIREYGEKARWGIHAKTYVVDSKTSVVSTFNMDPRSKNLNTELALICHNNEALAGEILSNIDWRMKNSSQLGEDGFPTDGSTLFEHVELPKQMEYLMLMIPANLMDWLL